MSDALNSASADFRPTANWPMLQRRAELLAQLRTFFAGRGFLEVETPLLSADTVVDTHLDPLSVTLFSDARRPEEGRTMWLQTSPEFGMKRLMAAGGEAIFQVTRAFRGGERGALHNPEFTLVEWYRRGDDYAAGMALLAELVAALLRLGAAERVTYRAAFEQHVGVNPHTAPVNELAAAATRHKLAIPAGFESADRDHWLHWLLTALVEPKLGTARPAILCDYPASQAALARTRPEESYEVAERFELYARGIELANGYHELLDAAALARRASENNRLRAAEGKYTLPEESRLLDAMQTGLPACAGTALGFDRLVMIATGAKTIDEVLAFPIERA